MRVGIMSYSARRINQYCRVRRKPLIPRAGQYFCYLATHGRASVSSAEDRMNMRPFQFTLKSVLLVSTAFASLLGVAAWLFRPDWKYTGQLHAVIKGADRVVVRDGGHDWPDAVDAHPVLFEIRDAQEIDLVRQQIVFERNQYAGAAECGCRGYPVIDWYRGDTRIALTTLKHGELIVWDGFADGAALTDKSGQRIVEWLVRNGVPRNRL
jgi:hypothetical protein